SVKGAIKIAEKKGLKIGLLRLKTIWPFPIKEVVELSQQVRKIIVPEINMGQIVHFVREYAHCEVISMPHPGGSLHSPEEIYAKIKEVIS
ncbi:MAG: 2-oxoacid:acceptor oxidoreductase subunit alpha, partial [Candidatus Heimdallarchaeota archaeon]|nr:2-oxoacid:acceptor oxidoreductase subunit alpha [Candidatus Heimdallarchaeota archaeon]